MKTFKEIFNESDKIISLKDNLKEKIKGSVFEKLFNDWYKVADQVSYIPDENRIKFYFGKDVILGPSELQDILSYKDIKCLISADSKGLVLTGNKKWKHSKNYS